MDYIKDKYKMRFFLATIGFFFTFTCVFLTIYYLESIFIIIPLVLLDIVLFFVSYQSLMYRLALRNKFDKVFECKLELSEEYNKKLESQKKKMKIIDKMLIYSLYISPIIILLSIILGIFVSNSLLLAIVIPSIIIVYLIILFFIKDIYSNVDYLEEKSLKEIVYINQKTITYMGSVYIFNYCGFHFKNNTYKFLFIPLSKPKFNDELLKKIDEAKENDSRK